MIKKEKVSVRAVKKSKHPILKWVLLGLLGLVIAIVIVGVLTYKRECANVYHDFPSCVTDDCPHSFYGDNCTTRIFGYVYHEKHAFLGYDLWNSPIWKNRMNNKEKGK